jgi:hypothetical protein
VSSIKLNETPKTRTQSYADGITAESGTTSRRETTPAIPSHIIRQYLQQLSQQQGQLPDVMAQKQQALLRQLSNLLESQTTNAAPLDTSATPSTGKAAAIATNNQPLQQLLQRLLPLLPANDPLLKQPIAQRGNEVILLRQIANSSLSLSNLMRQFSPALQESSPQGRALMQWLVQSITLRLTPDKLPRNLASQLVQQQITLPSAEPDKRPLQNLENLNKATLQFIQQSMAASSSNKGHAESDPAMSPAKTDGAANPDPTKLARTPQAEVTAGKAASHVDKLPPQLVTEEMPSGDASSGQESDLPETETAQSKQPVTQTPLSSSDAKRMTSGQLATATVRTEVVTSESKTTPDSKLTQTAAQTDLKITNDKALSERASPVTNAPSSNKAPGSLPVEVEHTATVKQVNEEKTPVVNRTAASQTETPNPPRQGAELAASSISAPKSERLPLLQRVASALLHIAPHSAEQSTVPVNEIDARSQSVPSRISLGAFVHEINQHLAAQQFPAILKPALKNLVDALAQPLTQPDAVEQWFDFLRQPLSSDSTAGRALQQWALTLLSIRLQQLGRPTDDIHPTPQQQMHQLLNSEEHQQLTHKLATSLFGQTERLQQQQQDGQQLIPNYVPLPPQQSSGREGGLSMQRGPGKQSTYQWTLSFFIELPQLGPLQIRACLDIPDIQLQIMAERLAAVDKIKETLPLLEGRFRELGLTPGAFVCRQGKVARPADEDETSPGGDSSAGFSIRI